MLPALSPQMDPKRLIARLAGLRFRLRLAAVVLGVSAVTAILVGGTAAAGLLDWRFGLPPLVRAMALVGILGAAGFALLRILVAPLRQPIDNLRLALQLEEKNPHLNDILASAVEFLERPDPEEERSSQVLRKITIRHAVRQSNACSFGELVNVRGLLWSTTAVIVAIGLAVPPILMAPAKAATALRRLAFPFGAVQWPPQTELQIVAPDKWPHRLALGEPLELRAELRGIIPERATLSVWFDGIPPAEQTWVVTPGKTPDQATLVARVEASKISRSFRFRLKANDADTDWREVLVLPPPELAPLDGRPSPQILLEYPAYTDLPARQLPDGGGAIEAVAGTAVHLRAATNRPVARSWIVYRPEYPTLSAAAALAPLAAATSLECIAELVAGETVWAPVPVNLSRDGRVLEVTFTPRVSGVYALRFEDDTGFGATRLLDVRVIPDPAPTVTLYWPSAGHDSLNVTLDADLRLMAVAADPMFAVRSCWLEYRTNKSDTVRSRGYYDHQAVGTAAPAILSGLAGPFAAEVRPLRVRWQEISVINRLRIASFRHADGTPLKEGDVLVIQMVANDFDEIAWDKAPGRSHQLELRIVNSATLEAMLNRDQSTVRQSLLRLQQWQREAREKVTEARESKEKAGKLTPGDFERVIQAEQLQQQIRARIGDDKEGLRAEINRIRQAQRDNKLAPTAAKDRMDAVAGELERLAREELEPIESQLNAARENIDPEKKNEPNKKDPLAEANRRQQEVERTLSSLLERLEPWSGANELRGETRSLLTEQQRIQQQTEQMDRQLADKLASGKIRERLDPGDQGELDRTAGRQENLANQLRDLQEKLDRVANEKATQEKDRLAKADKLDAAAAERERQAQRAPDKKDAIEREANQLRAESREQREAAANLKREASAMKDAANAARNGPTPANGDKPSPAQPAKLDDTAKQAAKEIRDNHLGEAKEKQQQTATTLEKMLDALEERRRDDLDRLAKKMREAEQKLDDLAERQERLQKKAKEAQEIADPAQREKELERLARQQEQLRQETKELAQELSRLRAGEAGQSLSRAGREMSDAGQRLERGEKADDAQEEALQKLDDAQHELEQARQQVEEELMREKLAKATERVRGIRDRQEAMLKEAKRIHAAVLKAKSWEREVQGSLRNLRDVEEGLADELDSLIQQKFQPIKVVARLLEQSAEAMRQTAKKIDERNDDINARGENEPFEVANEDRLQLGILNWQELALRRLDQLLEALKPDKDMTSSGGSGGGGAGQPMGGRRRPDGEDIPLLAQLKALRAMQAEVTQRTEQFAKDHPDPSKLSDADRVELAFLRKMQRDVAELIQEYGVDEEPKGGRP